jgi:hypothetical protein
VADPLQQNAKLLIRILLLRARQQIRNRGGRRPGRLGKIEFSRLNGNLMVPEARLLICIGAAHAAHREGADQFHERMRAMKKLLTIIALAATVVSAPAFAKASTDHAAASRHYPQSQESGIPWIDDQAKGYVG